MTLIHIFQGFKGSPKGQDQARFCEIFESFLHISPTNSVKAVACCINYPGYITEKQIKSSVYPGY